MADSPLWIPVYSLIIARLWARSMYVYLCADTGTLYSDPLYEGSLSAEPRVHYTREKQKFFKGTAVFLLHPDETGIFVTAYT